MSTFADIELASPVEVFAMVAEYNNDTDPNRVNVSVGAYRTNDGKPWVLPVVHSAEALMLEDDSLNHEYLPVAGLADFRKAACRLLLGKDDNRIGGIQTLGGTGAIRLCADFTKKHLACDTVYVSKPTWGNHIGVFKAAGFNKIVEYRYWSHKNRNLDIEGMLEDLTNAPPKSVVILHAVAHNPTGVDPTHEQWVQIANVCKEKKIFVLIDCAYQGFTSGDLEVDGWSSRYFMDNDFEFFVAQSFSKNFGLYNERVGNLCVVAKNGTAKASVCSQLEMIVRTTWSNPPNHGARIVATILNNTQLMGEWKGHILTMSKRILHMRAMLHQKLKANGCPGNWDHVINQKGMFSYTGLNEQQCEKLKKNYHIYIMKSGRINMCGLTTSNIDYVADSIKTVVDDDAEHQTQEQCKV